jgi:nucleotide-binding universal stress UspA family protein
MKRGPVMAATDFSELSDAAAAVARDLARELGTTLHLVHVVPPVTDPVFAASCLAKAAERLGPRGSLETALLSGHAAPELVRYARERDMGLIVMATHGRTGFTRALLGSVAEAVVRCAPCPVLTVPVGRPADARAEVEPIAPAAVPRCIVCAADSPDLVCETCRTRLRAEALHRKVEEERAPRGLPI